MPNLFWRTPDGKTINLAETPFKTEDEFQEVRSQVPGGVKTSYILEPFGRNTAAAIGPTIGPAPAIEEKWCPSKTGALAGT